MELLLHRGITVPAGSVEDTVKNIREQGFHSNQNARWVLPLSPLRERLDVLREKVDLSTGDTFKQVGEFLTVCATGDIEGASYYATHHNKTDRNSEAIIISFKAHINSVFVDGRDFLYSCFQSWDRNGTSHYEKQAEILLNLFGPQCLVYFEKLRQRGTYDGLTSEQRAELGTYRIALAALAVQDPDIVQFHHANQNTIHGRGHTVFRSAFQVRMPVEPSQIIDIRTQLEWLPSPGVDLSGFFLGRNEILAEDNRWFYVGSGLPKSATKFSSNLST